MAEFKMEITVTTDKELTDEEKIRFLRGTVFRMEGFHVDPSFFPLDASMEIRAITTQEQQK
jgi:hypothetical protein